MIIKLDHYRKSKSRALVDSYYSQPAPGDTAPERELAQVLYAARRPAPGVADDRESVATPEKS